MKKFMLLGIVLCVSGCAAAVVSSSERSVVVKARHNDVAAAQALADAECRKHGRHAQLKDKFMGHQVVFDCVD